MRGPGRAAGPRSGARTRTSGTLDPRALLAPAGSAGVPVRQPPHSRTRTLLREPALLVRLVRVRHPSPAPRSAKVAGPCNAVHFVRPPRRACPRVTHGALSTAREPTLPCECARLRSGAAPRRARRHRRPRGRRRLKSSLGRRSRRRGRPRARRCGRRAVRRQESLGGLLLVRGGRRSGAKARGAVVPDPRDGVALGEATWSATEEARSASAPGRSLCESDGVVRRPARESGAQPTRGERIPFSFSLLASGAGASTASWVTGRRRTRRVRA